MSADSQYFEQQYNNRLSIPDAASYNERAVARSIDARRDLDCVLDVPCGPSPRQRLDLFRARRADAPLLSFIHGGYWRSREKSDFSFVARPFVEAGISVALPTYDLAPQVTVETIVQQMLAAHAWLYRHGSEYGVRAARLCVAGHSAGGHLAAMLACAKWEDYAPDLPADLVKGAFAISGVFDLMPMLQFSFNADIRLDAAMAKKVSPLTYYPARCVPLYTAVGELESDEFKRQAKAIAQAWPHCFIGHVEVPGCHHLSILEALADPNSALFAAVHDMVAVQSPPDRERLRAATTQKV